MATDKPRINMALRREHYDVVTRLAKVQGRSRSAIVVELLEAAIPTLERVVVVTEAAMRAQTSARDELVASLKKAEAAVMPHVNAALGQLDMLLAIEQPKGSAKAQGSGRAAATARAERSEAPAVRRRSPGSRSRGPDPRPVTRGSGRGTRGGKSRSAKGRKTQ